MNNYGNLVLIGIIVGILLFPIAIPLYLLYKWHVKKVEKNNQLFIEQERKKIKTYSLKVNFVDNSNRSTDFNDRVQADNIMLSLIQDNYKITSAILNNNLNGKAYLWDNETTKFIDTYQEY